MSKCQTIEQARQDNNIISFLLIIVLLGNTFVSWAFIQDIKDDLPKKVCWNETTEVLMRYDNTLYGEFNGQPLIKVDCESLRDIKTCKLIYQKEICEIR